MVNPKIEVCANSAASCVAAEQGGAVRVELCAGIPEGGTTPSYGEMVTARRAIGIQLNVIIRPRGGDFLYTPAEMQTMLLDIEAAKAAGADGVVFGCLRADGTIDVERNAELMAAAGGLSTTFHRAFDVCRDPFEALEEIIALGFDRILTSGQEASGLGIDCRAGAPGAGADYYYAGLRGERIECGGFGAGDGCRRVPHVGAAADRGGNGVSERAGLDGRDGDGRGVCARYHGSGASGPVDRGVAACMT